MGDHFKKITFLSFLFALSVVHSTESLEKVDKPCFLGKGGSTHLVLPPKMKTALNAYNPHFKPWKMSQYLPSHLKEYKLTPHQAPFAVIGDFNGDGILDVVLYGTDGKSEDLVVILSEGDGFKVIDVYKGPYSDPAEFWTGTEYGREYGLDEWLNYDPKGKVDLGEHGVLHLETESFDLDIQHKGGAFYYWKKGKFHQISDGC